MGNGIIATEAALGMGKSRMVHTQDFNAHLRHLAERYAQVLHETLPQRLVSVVLFGSVARGEAGPTSDIDLFVVLEDAPRGMMARRALLAPAREALTPDLEALWQRGVYVDFVEMIRGREEAQRFHPVYLDMTNDAVILYDKEGFFQSVLARLYERLHELGARKERVGDAWYWVLKPDLQPGEVFEV